MFLLVGAGGHGRTIADMIEIGAYVDPQQAWWTAAEHIPTDEAAMKRTDLALAIGIGSVSPESCWRRREIAESYIEAGFMAPALAHHAAVVSHNATVGDGSQVLPCAVVQPFAKIGRFCLINSGAIVDHDCTIGDGSHVSTGAVLGGGVTVGKDCMIGMGAVVLPYTVVPDGTLVKAQTRYPK